MSSVQLAPPNDLAIRNFGKNDRTKLRNYLLMLAAFLEARPPETRRAYKTSIRQFFDLFDWISPEDVTVAHVAAFKKWLLERRQVSDATAYARMSAASSFFDYLCKSPDAVSDPLLRQNPFRLVSRSDIQPTPYGRAKAMEWETFRSMIDTIPADAIGMRDKAILLFLAFTGRRRREVANLRIRDLDLKSRPRSYTCRVKGGELKSFELPEICYDAIRAYWIIADRLDDLRPDAGVFTAVGQTPLTQHLDPNKPLDVRTLNRVIHRAAVRAGLDPDDDSIGLHAMRHMAARDLDKAGVRLQDIQAFLGHASPLTTQIYLQRLSGPASAHTDALLRVRREAEALAQEAVRSE